MWSRDSWIARDGEDLRQRKESDGDWFSIKKVHGNYLKLEDFREEPRLSRILEQKWSSLGFTNFKNELPSPRLSWILEQKWYSPDFLNFKTELIPPRFSWILEQKWYSPDFSKFITGYRYVRNLGIEYDPSPDFSNFKTELIPPRFSRILERNPDFHEF